MAKQGRHIAGSYGTVSVGEGGIERPSVLHTVHSNGYHNSSETPVHHLPPIYSSTAQGCLCNQLVCVLFYHSVIIIVHGKMCQVKICTNTLKFKMVAQKVSNNSILVFPDNQGFCRSEKMVRSQVVVN